MRTSLDSGVKSTEANPYFSSANKDFARLYSASSLTSCDIIGSGNPAHEDKEKKNNERQMDTLTQSGEAEEPAQKRQAYQDHGGGPNGGAAAEADGQKKKNGQNDKPNDLLGRLCRILYSE